VSLRSISEEARRLGAKEDLTFRVIFEVEKAKRHRDLFAIGLESFYRRSSVMLERVRGQLEEPQPHEQLFYRVVRTKEEVYDIVNSSFHRTGQWYELPHGLELKTSWNLLWTWSRPQIDFGDLLLFQKVNHFLENKQLARKDLLKKNIEKVQRLGAKAKAFFDIIPETFLLPGQNIAFIKKFREQGLVDPLNYWILKPVGLSRGRGISLVNRLDEVVFAEPVVLQRYISNPLLLDGFKFDMRIYVLVTSISPLEAFLYREGFARLSTLPYSLSQELMDNKLVHLTNFSIQREQPLPGKQPLEEELGGSKVSLGMLAGKLRALGVSWEGVWRQIQAIVLKSLVACMGAIPANPNSFELFGYDIFLDEDQRCWLLEVNSSPSLEKEFTLDRVIKQQLVDDIVEVVAPLNYDRQRLLEVVHRRRREAEGLKSSISASNNSPQQLDADLAYILRGQRPRAYGEGVGNANFEMVAPSAMYERVLRVVQQYKVNPIVPS
jgi:tubulin polyglutamylase TTLL5